MSTTMNDVHRARACIFDEVVAPPSDEATATSGVQADEGDA